MSFNPIKTKAELLDRFRAGLTWLRETGLVEPMELVIQSFEPGMAISEGTKIQYAGRWQFCKYVARPGHSKPRGANHGYSHPERFERGGEKGTAGDADCEMPTPDELRAIFCPLPVTVTADYYKGNGVPFQIVVSQVRLTRELLNSAVP